MANNRLILRKMTSPWVTRHMDITRSTTLTHVELDSNFVYLKGEVITSVSVDGNTLILNKINGNTIDVDIEGLSGDTGQTLNLINQLRGELDEDALWEAESAGSKSIKLKNSDTIGATVYTPRLNIKVEPSRDNSVTQVLVRDSDGYVKYKDVSSFTDLSVVGGDYNVQTGVVTLTNNDGNSFDISGFSKNMTDSYTTNAYIEDGVMYFDNNVHGPKYYQVNVNELINVIIDRGDCSEEQYSQYLKLANEYESINDDKVKHENELAGLEGDVSELYKLINTLKIQVDSLDPEQDADQIAKLAAQIKIYNNSVEEKLKLISVSKDKIKLLSSNSILEFATYMPINESNFNCWARTQIINIIGYEDRGACSEDDYNTYVKMGQKVLDENENIQTLQLELSENERILKTYKDRISELEAMPQPLPADLQKELNVLIEDGYSLEAEIKRDSEIIKNWLESDDSDFITQYMPINEVNFICWKHSQLLSIIEECCKDDVRGDCSDDKYSQYLELANEYSTTKDLFDTTTETQTQLTILINEGVTTISEKEAQLLKLKKQLEDLLNSGGGDNAELIAELQKQIASLTKELESLAKVLDSNKRELVDVERQLIEITSSGILEFEVYMPINEVNFDCWSEQLIIDAVGYDDRGECSLKSYTQYTAEANNYKKIKKHYDELIKEQSELMTQVTQFKTDIADLIADRTSKQSDLDRLKSEDPNNALIPVLEEEIKQLNRGIEDFTAQLSQNEDELEGTNERIQIIEYSGDLDFVAYMPVNEVNFDCWSEAKLYNELNIKIESITNTVGYDDRGKCSSDKYTVYLEEVAKYESKKSHYDSNIEERDNLKVVIDELEVDIDTLETEINDLSRIILIGKLNGEDQSDNESLKSNKEAELSDKETDLLQNKDQYSSVIEQIKIIEDSGDLEFVAYIPANEINFDCWTEQQIIDAVGYGDRGDCSEELYEEYVTYCKTLEDSKEVYDRLLEQKTAATNVRVVENADYQKEKAVIEGNISFYQAELNKIKQLIEDEGREPTAEEQGKINLFEQLIADYQKEIEALINNEEASQEAFKRFIEDLQKEMDKWLISNEAIDYVKYLPVNEVNFDCWTEAKLYNELNIKIESITNTVGYDDRGKCSSDKYTVYLEEVAKYESKKSHYDSNIEERDSVKLVIDELEADIDTLETELIILNNDRLYKVSIGESIEELQKIISDKEAELSDKETELTILKDRYSLAIEEIKIIEDSSDLEFVAYMPANEINFDCWTEQQIIDAVGYGDRGDCSEALYEEYINIVNVSNDFYNKSLVPPSNWDALDLPDSISYKDLSLYMNKSVEFRNNQVLEFNQTLALYDSELTKYQAILDPLKVIENPTEEQLAEINGLEKIIKLLNANREDLISDNNTDEKLYIELTKWFSDNIDYWNNSEYKVILETYGPVNEVNFICYVNNLQNDKIDKLIEDNEYKIYNIESQLNDSSLDNEGTFNYYPNIYDDFSGNPKFSVGNFDELDSIINLSSNDLVTWGKLVCNGGVDGATIKNLITSIRCIESLENEIASIEAEESNDFNNLKNIYETEIQNLRSQQQSDPRLTTDLLEVKLSNMIAERSLNSDSYEYMVDKLQEVLKVYKQVQVIADDFCDNGGA